MGEAGGPEGNRRCAAAEGGEDHRSPESVLTAGHWSPYSVGGGGGSGIRRVGTGTGHGRGRVESGDRRRWSGGDRVNLTGLTGRPFIRVVPGLTRRAASSPQARPDGRVGPGTARVLPCRAGLATGQNSVGPRAAWWARTIWTTIPPSIPF
jgi:hypothetical protein